MPVADIASLIPHQGGMCLLERIVEWTDEHIVMETATHRSPCNPLRRDGALRAIHLCEYGAQAMAVHGALKSPAAATRPAPFPTPGMLVSLRSVSFTRDFIDDLPSDLRVEARCIHADTASMQYSFHITHANALLAQGRAAVILG